MLFAVVLFFQKSFSQVTFIVEELSNNNSINSDIYISGNFEDWTGGQKKYKLDIINNKHIITIPNQNGSIDFKFTKGSWDEVETDVEGHNIQNRTYTFQKEKDTVKLKILGWAKNTIRKSTSSKNVSIISDSFDIPQLNRERRIWIYLPPNYDTAKKTYPVIYMHDGQNLFDNRTSYSGEWEVDETLNRLFKEKGFELIVIGIDNGGSRRLDEYSPWKNNKYGGGEGSAYVDFIVQTLKPYVDKNYRTKLDNKNTAIMGSSMGGLISYYAGSKYPKVFSKIGVFSPSFWFSNESFSYAKTHGKLKKNKMYFLAGDREGSNDGFVEINQTVQDMNKVIKILKQEGFDSDKIFTKVVPGGEHNEKLWRENFGEAILWLFNK